MHVFIKVWTPITRKLSLSPKIDKNKSVLELNFRMIEEKNYFRRARQYPNIYRQNDQFLKKIWASQNCSLIY